MKPTITDTIKVRWFQVVFNRWLIRTMSPMIAFIKAIQETNDDRSNVLLNKSKIKLINKWYKQRQNFARIKNDY